MWLASLFLKGGAVNPTYVSVIYSFCLFISMTVAWYIAFSAKHCPPKGQVAFLGQLHILGCSVLDILDSTFLLCFEIICFKFGVVL